MKIKEIIKKNVVMILLLIQFANFVGAAINTDPSKGPVDESVGACETFFADVYARDVAGLERMTELAAKQKIYIEKLERELACYKCEDSQRQNNAKPKVLDFRAPESWIINKPYAIRSVCQDMDNGLKEVKFFIRNKGDSVWEPFLADRKHSLSGTEDFVTLYHRMKEAGSYEIRVSCRDADYHDEDNRIVSFEVVEAPEADVYGY